KQDRFQEKPSERTRIGSDVWIGSNVLIMGGVNIGDGAVVGAGAVVTEDLPPFSINVGIPAKTIKYRFTEEQRDKLLADKWWEKDEGWILSNIDRFSDVEEFVK
ncbi:MAG: acetyltransferase, partial [Lachnospiraceae bacterium]|nr:acetyltransferase [Lachnospiraceae bacterium]